MSFTLFEKCNFMGLGFVMTVYSRLIDFDLCSNVALAAHLRSVLFVRNAGCLKFSTSEACRLTFWFEIRINLARRSQNNRYWNLRTGSQGTKTQKAEFVGSEAYLGQFGVAAMERRHRGAELLESQVVCFNRLRLNKHQLDATVEGNFEDMFVDLLLESQTQPRRNL